MFRRSQKHAARNRLAVAGSLGIGAALMYYLDPGRGARRRSALRDHVARASNLTEEGLGITARDVRNRAQGAIASTRSRLSSDMAEDSVIVARVRSELGRVTSHPSAILVTAQNGHLTLSGPVLAGEVDPIMRRIRTVRGVGHVENQLEPHEKADIPALQGGRVPPGNPSEFRKQNWAPAIRLVAGAAGGAAAIYGAARRGPFGAALALGGVSLAARGVTNLQLKRLIGIGAGRNAVDLQKTININAPRDVVFAYLRDFENWPRFMTHVREVRENADGRTHWIVDGPLGAAVEWDSEITRFVPDEIISWKSLTGSPIQHSGTLFVSANADNSTRVHVQMSYNPIAGAAGHAVAKLFGADPKKQLDDDLARLKTTIETGQPPHDAAQPGGEEVVQNLEVTPAADSAPMVEGEPLVHSTPRGASLNTGEDRADVPESGG